MFHSQCQMYTCAILTTESDTRPYRPVRQIQASVCWNGPERRDSQRGQSWAEVQTRQPPIPPGPKSAYTNSVEETPQA